MSLHDDDDDGMLNVAYNTVTTPVSLNSLLDGDRILIQGPISFPRNNITPSNALGEDEANECLAEAPVASSVISTPTAPDSIIPTTEEDSNVAEAASNEPFHRDNAITTVGTRLPPVNSSSVITATTANSHTNAIMTLRFRGAALSTLGFLYPSTRFHVHRINHPGESDFEADGRDLITLVTNTNNLRRAIFRVTMKSLPEAPQAGKETVIIWSKRHAIASAGGAGDYPTGEEYRNIVKLGGTEIPGTKLMLFTYFARDNQSWGLARQAPGIEYTLEQCFDILRVPRVLRAQIDDFGPRRWQVGGRLPRL